ncbi:tectonin domain-containing protein, partial [Streptomyces sparsogenes]
TGDRDANNWKGLNGSLKAIDVGSRTSVWGCDPADAIYHYTYSDTTPANPWINIPGSLSDIGVGADGTVWGVNAAGAIYRYTGDLPG